MEKQRSERRADVMVLALKMEEATLSQNVSALYKPEKASKQALP